MVTGAAAAVTCTSGSYFAGVFAALPVVTVPGDYPDINAALGGVLTNGQGGGSIVLADIAATAHTLDDVYMVTGPLGLCIQGAGQGTTTIVSAGGGMRHFVANESARVQIVGLTIQGAGAGEQGGGGGGMVIKGSTQAALYNTVFVDNSNPNQSGGGMLVEGAVVRDAR